MSVPRILLLGKNGQVGWELQRSLAPLGQLVALDRAGLSAEAAAALGLGDVGPLCGDLTDLDGLARTVLALRPQAIVNAAAYTAVEKAESEPELVQLVNTKAPAVIASACDQIGALVVHYSIATPYDGHWDVSALKQDRTKLHSVYCHSKLDSEKAIKTATNKHLIFLTSCLFGAQKRNYLKEVLIQAGKQDGIYAIHDEIITPTSASFIADATAIAIKQIFDTSISGVEMPGQKTDIAKVTNKATPPLYGTYEVMCAGRTNWFNYAIYVLQSARLHGMLRPIRAEKVKAISSAHRGVSFSPFASCLASRPKLQNTFRLKVPMWQHEVEKVLLQIKNRSVQGKEIFACS